jgi:hypothetical protein
MDGESTPASATDVRGPKWIVAAIFGGIVLAYAGYAFAFYKIIDAIV